MRALRSAAVLLLFCVGWSGAGWAQEPPLDVPKPARLTKPTDVLSVGEWLLYPTLRGFGLWSDNLFQSSTAPLNTAGLGIAPSLVAEWTNGIHSTTLYGNFERRIYPGHSDINAFDWAAGASQRYEPLRDLTMSVQGDVFHRTFASSLINGIPPTTTTPTTTQLPNGNTVLPNGNIVDPSGAVVGQTTPALNVAAANNIVVNPFNNFSTTATITKLFNRGIWSVSGTLAKTEYEQTTTTPDYQTKSLRVHGGQWTGPLLYLYTDGAFAWTDFAATPTATNPVLITAPDGTLTTATPGGSKSFSYRAVGGIGSERIGLMRGSVYAGHQGSETTSATSTGTAGGDVYGGRLNYQPTPYWTFNATVEHIINIASGNTASIIAQPIAPTSPIALSAGSSTRTTQYFLDSNYALSKEWSLLTRFGLTHVEFVGTSRIDDAWLADTVLTYQLIRNLTLSWEYQYTSVVSNTPFVSSQRNYVIGTATYKF